MASIKERVAAIRLHVISPDETVEGFYSQSDGTVLRLDPEISRLHNEETLEEQLEAVLTELLDAYEEERLAIAVEKFPRMGEQTQDPQTPAARRRAMIAEIIAEIQVKGRSPKRAVELDWNGHRDLMAVLQEGVVSKMNPRDLTGEVLAAFADAADKRQTELTNALTGNHKRDTKHEERKINER